MPAENDGLASTRADTLARWTGPLTRRRTGDAHLARRRVAARALLAVTAASLTACVSAIPCTTDADCQGGWCHPAERFCVTGDAGATGGGGGATTGGGGATGGGATTTGGGGTTTGGGGGTTTGGGGGGTVGGGGGATGGGLAVAFTSLNCKRDETVYALVRNVGPSPSLTLSFLGTISQSAGVTPVASSFCAGLGVTANDACLAIECWGPRLDGLSGTFQVTVTDDSTNQGVVQPGFTISRVRWQTMTGPVIAPPVLDSQGNLWVGTNAALLELSPGGMPMRSLGVDPVHSLALARTRAPPDGGVRDAVFLVTGTDGGSEVSVVDATTGGYVTPGAPHCGSVDVPVASIALLDGGSGDVDVAALFGSGARGLLCRSNPGDGLRWTQTLTAYAVISPPASNFGTHPNLVARRSEVTFQAVNDTLVTATLVPDAGMPRTIVEPTGADFPTGLAMSGNGSLVSTRSGLNTPVILYPQVPDAGAVLVTGWSSSTAWPAIVSGTGFAAPTATVNTGDAVLSAATSFGTATTLNAQPLSSMAPFPAAQFVSGLVLGKNNQAFGVTREGTLFVYPTSAMVLANAKAAWSARIDGLATGQTFLIPANLDCNRLRPASGVGVLYVTTAEGVVTAILVDSPRLDGLAPWPRWQRTAGAAGNLEFDVSPGCPP